ncbi:hypothetical protein [Nocardia paucivorans]|uniref:hypothetical protein n=1 Tax=Nocardia paucivorans TaxID=114259 RepID=UPI0012F75AE4|nr:hypothetical protein [Nocardia paucivorans]
MGRRPRRAGETDSGMALFDAPGTRRDPTPDCPHCRGDGWELDAAGDPVEPAIRCRCTAPAHV